jgi:hypothetical protein
MTIRPGLVDDQQQPELPAPGQRVGSAALESAERAGDITEMLRIGYGVGRDLSLNRVHILDSHNHLP